jgi:chromosome segregation ATPase
MSAALSLCGRLVAATAHGAEQHCRPSVFYDECHADSLSQIQSFWRVEDALTNLRQNLLLQQCGLDEISSGKDWLEAQWKEGQDECARLTEVLTSLQAGKDWLEAQWKEGQDERARLTEVLTSLQAGKDWLEAQWKEGQDECARLTEVLTSLQAGKDWLETQWNAQAKEILSGEQRLSALSAENVRLSSDLENVRKRTARLKRNVFFRVAKKLGLFSYF